MESSGPLSEVVHAVMLNWNSYELNAPCIVSLKKSRHHLEKIIVVDNGSTDGSRERLEREFNDDQMVFIRNQRNEGFARGVNIGIRHALDNGADQVFLVNNDTIIDEDCVRRLCEVLRGDPLGAAAGPAIMYYSNPEKLWQAGGYFRKLKMGVKVPGKGMNLSDIDQSVSQVTFLTGCALLLPAETLERVGLMDPAYFFYGDDVDYCLRIKEAGLNIYFVPTAKVWHKIEDIAADRTSPYVLFHLARSTVIMLRKRFVGIERVYGIALQYLLYTPFRFWQIIKGGAGFDSFTAWLKGLWAGTTVRLHE